MPSRFNVPRGKPSWCKGRYEGSGIFPAGPRRTLLRGVMKRSSYLVLCQPKSIDGDGEYSISKTMACPASAEATNCAMSGKIASKIVIEQWRTS